jgi:hypothetical protein
MSVTVNSPEARIFASAAGKRPRRFLAADTKLDTTKLRLTSLISKLLAIGTVLLPTTGSAWMRVSQDTPSQRPGVGATQGVTVTPYSSPSSGTYTRRHVSPNGTVCVYLGGVARPFTTNDKLFNHWISAENRCSDRIRIKVCYYATTNCIDMNLAGHEQKEAILGTLPAVKDFRYEYQEQF